MFSELSVIKSDTQYRAYLGEIGRLMMLDPEPTTAEGRRLELLALIVETYEKNAIVLTHSH